MACIADLNGSLGDNLYTFHSYLRHFNKNCVTIFTNKTSIIHNLLGLFTSHLLFDPNKKAV